MKVVIFCGGKGTRIIEESISRPKPLIEVGGKPLVMHIIDHYRLYGCTEFILLTGYRAHDFEAYFDYFGTGENPVSYVRGEKRGKRDSFDFNVTLLPTGLNSQTGFRLSRARDLIGRDTFFLTYGDGVSDIPIDELYEAHKASNVVATVTATKPLPRFGSLEIDDLGFVSAFSEKSYLNEGWINGGFFVCEPTIFDFLDGSNESFEEGPLSRVVGAGKLAAFKYEGFWHPCDTMRDKIFLDAYFENKA